MTNQMLVDIIIISYAQTNELRQITLSAIESLMASEDKEQILFNVIVVESEKSLEPYQYPNSMTIYPEGPFGYHKYLNIGMALCTAPFICLCNNDLVFYSKWASEILKQFSLYNNLMSASPICSVHHKNNGYKLNDGIKLGYRIRDEISGWCIFVKREIFKVMGKLDENYVFWCADNDYANTLHMLKIYHALITTSIVDHLESKTLKQQSKQREMELTENELVYIQKKWNCRVGYGWQPINADYGNLKE
jgi:GT2 family glycosyltransferase